MDLQAIHAETLRGTARVVDGVRADQLEKPTPCTEWDVRALINHMVGVNDVRPGGAGGAASGGRSR